VEADPREPGPRQQRIETPLQEVGGVECAAPLAIATVTGTLVVASTARAATWPACDLLLHPSREDPHSPQGQAAVSQERERQPVGRPEAIACHARPRR